MSYKIGAMTRAQLDETLQWAAKEGWNPGLNDADAFWAADPEGFLAIERDGELIGTGAIISYGRVFGFMGLFMVKPEVRGQGVGRDLWYYRRDSLRSRLNEHAPIALDGVEHMQDFYAKGGFQKTHDHVRHSFRPCQLPRPRSQLRGQVLTPELAGLAQVEDYDLHHFGAPRSEFLKLWLQPPQGQALVVVDEQGLIAGLGVIRAAHEGFRIGPLFARDQDFAETLLRALGEPVSQALIQIDIPSINLGAQDLATKLGLQVGFRCGRMYNGPELQLPWQEVFGVTSLELG